MVRITNILQEIKHLLGIEKDDDSFDTDIAVHIDSAFMTLNQIGVGPTKVFSLKTGEETWDDFIPAELRSEGVRQYVYIQVRLAFDPPSSSYIIAAYERQLTELVSRLMMHDISTFEDGEEMR